MRAAVLTAHGAIENLAVIDTLTVPDPAPGEVRLRIHAAALNRLDLWVLDGWKGLDLHLPHVVGSDGAGTIDALGDGVTGCLIGDRVCVNPTLVPRDSLALMTGLENQSRIQIKGEDVSGFAAEYVIVPARNLLKLPDSVSYEQAAAAGLVYVTAWHSLITRGGLRPGETVLIVGAGGGVNTASLQIAKLAGATVMVVGSSAEKCERARALGADIVINRADTPDWSREVFTLTQKRGVDIVVDNVGQATFNQSIRAVRVGGRILVVGNTSGPTFEIDLRYIFRKHISIIGSTMGPHQDYVRVMNLVFEGKLQPVISNMLPLDEVQRGYQALRSGDVFGKVVLTL